MRTRRLTSAPDDVAAAAEIVLAGGLVAFPTETVYGLGADAGSDAATAKIFAAKDRPRFNPLIAHVPDLEAADRVARLTPRARLLAERFWPGPLTLIAERRPDGGVGDLAAAGLDTVGLRAPNHPLAQALLRRVGRPIAGPSANRSGRLSPTTPEHVLAELDGRIDAILDGGPCVVGVESTIVSVESDRATLLRPGGVAVEELEEALGARLETPDEDGPIASPGRLESHYAPQARLRLSARAPRAGEAWLGFGPSAAIDETSDRPASDRPPSDRPARSLSPTGDLVEAAAALFAHLRALDAEVGPDGVIAVAPVPDVELGRAINDRLRRAAAPRPQTGGSGFGDGGRNG